MVGQNIVAIGLRGDQEPSGDRESSLGQLCQVGAFTAYECKGSIICVQWEDNGFSQSEAQRVLSVECLERND